MNRLVYQFNIIKVYAFILSILYTVYVTFQMKRFFELEHQKFRLMSVWTKLYKQISQYIIL